MARKLERVEEQEIIQMYLDDVPVQEIAAEMAISKTTIYALLKREGVSLRAHQNIGQPSALEHMSEADIEAFLLDYRNTALSVQDVAFKWKMTSTTVYATLRLLQEPLRQTSKSHLESRKDQYDHAVRMYEQGYFIWQIVAETGIDQPSLHKELHKRRTPLRRGSPSRGKVHK
jgi:transposase-like protein